MTLVVTNIVTYKLTAIGLKEFCYAFLEVVVEILNFWLLNGLVRLWVKYVFILLDDASKNRNIANEGIRTLE
jgi:hypothetical protein